MPSSPGAEPRRAAPPGAVPSRPGPAIVVLGAALLALGACGGGPAPRLYVLEPIVSSPETRAATPDSAVELDALGISLVTLPGYARDPRLASRDAGNEISVDDAHRWAEEPDEAITRVFADRLRRHAGATVLIEPWPRNFAPDARVELAFDRLLREPSGGVDAAGQIRLVSGDGRDVLDVRPFRLSRSVGSTAPGDWFRALARLLDDLARLTVDTLGDGAAS